jgi:glycosyltransferase involved in cell wall biosynthesis
MKINFVQSNNIYSNIFTAFNSFFIKYSKNEYFITDKPIKHNIDIYHYHRPNLEDSLMENSIVTVHHDLEDNDPWFDSSNFINRYKEASYVVCLNSLQQSILKQEGIKNTAVIPHGYRDDLFTTRKPKLYNQDEKISLGIISKRYGRRVKGEAYLLELIKRLDSDKFKFILVGDGRTEDAVLLTNYGFEVEVFENLPYILYPEVYKKLDFLLMISLFEGGPANLPEALASGVPVIATNIAMVKDMIIDKENGLVLSGRYEDDVEKIYSLINNDGKLFNQLQKNLQKKQNIITWQEVVKQYENIYKKIGAKYEY